MAQKQIRWTSRALFDSELKVCIMNGRKSNLWILVFLTFLVATFGCQKDEDILGNCNCKNTKNRTCVIYEQTYCADPWEYELEDDEKLIKNLKDYFANLGVTLHDVGIDEEGTQQFCFACHCKSGRRFCAKVKNSDLAKVKEHGFKEK